MLTNVLNINDSNDGNRIKQGDKSVMRYRLVDTNNDDLNINGKSAKVFLNKSDKVEYVYQTEVKDNSVDLVIDDVIPAGIYTIEIWVENKYSFPSDNKAKIEVVESVVGKGIEDINNRNIWEEVLKFGIEKGLIKQDGGSDFVVGTQPPTDKNKIWIDTGVSE
ncbi:hypothetical protein [Staphylococcus warneri]|uniref:hypothetical protein n=1 Tax=Staphylococcus warneri TaxID=1292 RepID=UPI000D1D426F|nr:hypothetical protein [Staphylococcus warneri]PTI17226.1 hypothetical protein BU082_12580 [Staphylococcus warneri]PTI20705.1 hypothetical protein BU081_12715 [Staphylococcus warneri]RIM97213.1 hypothetical protein BU093_11265 [Staphylococcus warneri]RIN01249.1 hypothetical protein BU092_13195 [Staphylococcus warneri]